MWGHSALCFQTASAAIPEQASLLSSPLCPESLCWASTRRGEEEGLLSWCCVLRSVAVRRAALEPPSSSPIKGRDSMRSLKTWGVSEWLWSACLDGCVLSCTQRPLQVYIKVLPRLNQCIFSFSPLNAFLSFRLSPVFPGKGCWLGEVWQCWTPSLVVFVWLPERWLKTEPALWIPAS